MRSHSLLQACLASCLLAAVAPFVAAQQSRAAKGVEADDLLVLRTYEVGDLVFSVPDYALGTASTGASGRSLSMGGGMSGGAMGRGMGMGGGGMEMAGGFDAAPASGWALPLTIDSILQVILTTVAPGSWAQAGGAGQATALGNSLVILQTPAAHEVVSQLLANLRQGSATRRSMTVDARWLVLNSDDLEKLVVVGEGGEKSLNREALAAFTRQPTSLRAMVNCFSGQAVYLTSGTVRPTVASYIPVVGGGEGSVGYQPVVESSHFGVGIELRPTRLHPEEAAVVDLRSTVTFPVEPLQVDSRADSANTLAPKVDRIPIQAQKLATTVRVPLSEPVLVGGMTDVAPWAAPGTGVASGELAEGAGTGERPQLYLVLEVR